MRPDLLSWQLAAYPEAHRDRRNLALHLATVPIFAAGLAAAIAGVLMLSPWITGAGIAAAIAVVALQGRGHSREAHPPAPFSGPLDVLVRILAEQLITFPRFVVSGGFARAWREAH